MDPVKLLGVLQLLLEAETEMAQLDAGKELVLPAQIDGDVLQVREMLGGGQSLGSAEKILPAVVDLVAG